MSTNSVAAALGAGRTVVGGWCTTPSAYNAELLAILGFDYVGIDRQHGLIDDSDMVHMLMAVGHTSATPVVRVAANEAHLIGRALDAGAEIVIVPMVNSRAEAEAALAASRYPPEGRRSYGPVRAAGFLNRDAGLAQVNREVLCLPMIETVEALEAVDEICDLPGLAGVYVGPVDLALSMGAPPGGQPPPQHGDALERIRRTCAARGLVCGIHADGSETARRYQAAGFQMISISSDARLLRSAAEEQLAAVRASDSTGAAG